MLINGEWLNDAPAFPVFNPATGEEIGQVAETLRDFIGVIIHEPRKIGCRLNHS